MARAVATARARAACGVPQAGARVRSTRRPCAAYTARPDIQPPPSPSSPRAANPSAARPQVRELKLLDGLAFGGLNAMRLGQASDAVGARPPALPACGRPTRAGCARAQRGQRSPKPPCPPALPLPALNRPFSPRLLRLGAQAKLIENLDFHRTLSRAHTGVAIGGCTAVAGGALLLKACVVGAGGLAGVLSVTGVGGVLLGCMGGAIGAVHGHTLAHLQSSAPQIQLQAALEMQVLPQPADAQPSPARHARGQPPGPQAPCARPAHRAAAHRAFGTRPPPPCTHTAPGLAAPPAACPRADAAGLRDRRPV